MCEAGRWRVLECFRRGAGSPARGMCSHTKSFPMFFLAEVLLVVENRFLVNHQCETQTSADVMKSKHGALPAKPRGRSLQGTGRQRPRSGGTENAARRKICEADDAGIVSWPPASRMLRRAWAQPRGSLGFSDEGRLLYRRRSGYVVCLAEDA